MSCLSCKPNKAVSFSSCVSYAVQYAPDNIRVNTIILGQLHTQMVKVRLAKQRTEGDVSQ